MSQEKNCQWLLTRIFHDGSKPFAKIKSMSTESVATANAPSINVFPIYRAAGIQRWWLRYRSAVSGRYLLLMKIPSTGYSGLVCPNSAKIRLFTSRFSDWLSTLLLIVRINLVKNLLHNMLGKFRYQTQTETSAWSVFKKQVLIIQHYEASFPLTHNAKLPNVGFRKRKCVKQGYCYDKRTSSF